ncbi:WD repeat containing protein [Parasponia andersonii]|uniref:WD repeat containing protein n=1 Tax=Parasponia andersonii TaxID=3476 RepID=A0A2P5DRH3_PARAD|nr:WD repeat containing protein [Parasponia andersonii]
MITGGKSFVSAPPAFSNDAKRLLVCTGPAVSIFSTSTGLQISSLEGHTAPVTSVIVVPASSPAGKVLCFCWTASLDGTIRYWDFSVPELMKTVEVKMPVYSMVIPSLLDQTDKDNEKQAPVFAYVSVEDTAVQEKKAKTLRGQIRKCNLTVSRMAGGVVLGETPQPELITISPSGKFFGIHNKRRLHIWKVPASDSERNVVKKITLHHTKGLTVLAFHPTERIVAAGDISGRILIWRGFGSQTFPISNKVVNRRLINNEEERPGVRDDDEADSCSTWHWHPSEVNVLSFSSDGAYLYSGGREGVFVVWQLDTGKKKFLPRIGSPLLYFTDSPDPSLSSISCADNQIHILKMPSMEILKSISGIKLPFSFPDINKGLCSKFAFDHSAGLVALRTENYCVQFYSLFDDLEISEVQVCERNHQPGDEVTVVVNLVALSPDGSTMCTSEVKLPEEGIGDLVCLKFWASDSLNKSFSLSTIIYEPHRDAGVSAVAFHPTRQMAVSASYGGDFKIWVFHDEIQQNRERLQNSGWICHSVGSYKKKPMTAAAFSADGSVLAVAAETVITLWDPENNVLVAVLGEIHTPITSLSFAGKSEYLVAVSRGLKPQLSVCSMSKLSVSWSYKLQVEDLACAVDLSMFAVLLLLPKSTGMGSNEQKFQDRDGIILLFNVTDPVPVATWSVRKAKGGGLAFIQGNRPSFQQNVLDSMSSQVLLAYIDSDHEYVVFDPHNNEAPVLSLNGREHLAAIEEKGQFGYASIYGELPEFKLKGNQNLLAPSGPSERPWETIFSGSSHNLPPLTKLCSAFLESLLEKRTAIVE